MVEISIVTPPDLICHACNERQRPRLGFFNSGLSHADSSRNGVVDGYCGGDIINWHDIHSCSVEIVPVACSNAVC